MSKKIVINSIESVQANLEALTPLVQNLPQCIKDRLSLPFIRLNAETAPEFFNGDVGIKIWNVVDKHQNQQYGVNFEISASVVGGVIQPKPKAGGNFNFSLKGWTNVNSEGWYNATEAELAALGNLLEWCQTKEGEVPKLWFELSEASEMVLVPILEKGVSVKARDAEGKFIVIGTDSAGQPVYQKVLKDFLALGFMYTDAPLSGNGVRKAEPTRDEVASVDPKATPCLFA